MQRADGRPGLAELDDGGVGALQLGELVALPPHLVAEPLHLPLIGELARHGEVDACRRRRRRARAPGTRPGPPPPGRGPPAAGRAPSRSAAPPRRRAARRPRRPCGRGAWPGAPAPPASRPGPGRTSPGRRRAPPARGRWRSGARVDPRWRGPPGAPRRRRARSRARAAGPPRPGRVATGPRAARWRRRGRRAPWPPRSRRRPRRAARPSCPAPPRRPPRRLAPAVEVPLAVVGGAREVGHRRPVLGVGEHHPRDQRVVGVAAEELLAHGHGAVHPAGPHQVHRGVEERGGGQLRPRPVAHEGHVGLGRLARSAGLLQLLHHLEGAALDHPGEVVAQGRVGPQELVVPPEAPGQGAHAPPVGLEVVAVEGQVGGVAGQLVAGVLLGHLGEELHRRREVVVPVVDVGRLVGDLHPPLAGRGLGQVALAGLEQALLLGPAPAACRGCRPPGRFSPASARLATTS